MRGLVSGLIILAAVLLQSTLIPFISIRTVQPDLVLMVVIAFALAGGSARGSLVGFVSGLIQDLAVGTSLGLSSLAKTIVGYIAGLLEKSVLLDSIFLPAISVFVATLIHNLIYALASMIFKVGPEMMLVLKLLIPSALYNSAIALVVFPLIQFVVIHSGGER